MNRPAWFCDKCHVEVEDACVTNDERHDGCGNAVYVKDMAEPDELTKLKAVAGEMERALEPFANFVAIVGETQPQGIDDVLYAYHSRNGLAELRHQDCLAALAAFNKYRALKR